MSVIRMHSQLRRSSNDTSEVRVPPCLLSSPRLQNPCGRKTRRGRGRRWTNETAIGVHQPLLGEKQATKLHLRVTFQIVLNSTGLVCLMPEMGCKAINSAQNVIKEKEQGLYIIHTGTKVEDRKTFHLCTPWNQILQHSHGELHHLIPGHFSGFIFSLPS